MLRAFACALGGEYAIYFRGYKANEGIIAGACGLRRGFC
jgi:hypothetical protein